MKKIRIIGEWIRYVLHAKNAHSIHSPFVFDFYNLVVKGSSPKAIIREIKEEQRRLFNDPGIINHKDLGAGSKVHCSGKIAVKTIARSSLKPEGEAALLGRLADMMNARKILELGTSFGTTTLSVARHNPETVVHTLEGSPDIFRYASEMFQRKNCKNIIPHPGNFDDILPGLLHNHQPFDGFLIDGNHRREAVLKYFELCLKAASPDSFFVLDDIRWSEGMLQAWNEIARHQAVTVSVDLFNMGIVFTRPGLSKQHFVLRP